MSLNTVNEVSSTSDHGTVEKVPSAALPSSAAPAADFYVRFGRASSGALHLTPSSSTDFHIPLVSTLRAYITLTKPRIVLLVALTGFTSMVMSGLLEKNPLKFWLVFIGIILTAASANAFNQYLDRDIDSIMERTKKKRPLPQGKLTAKSAFLFAWIVGIVAITLLGFYGNLLAALLGLGTILFYVFVYTLWLKRRTPYNIVIGGAAGATAPLIGWAASTGHISLGSFLSFLIIFMWTPPHFWALALCLKEEYKVASVPMLPVVAGEDATLKQIFWYSGILIPLTLALFVIKDCGWIYLSLASLLGVEFLRRASQAIDRKDRPSYWGLFKYSILYLFLLYIAMIVDAVMRI